MTLLESKHIKMLSGFNDADMKKLINELIYIVDTCE